MTLQYVYYIPNKPIRPPPTRFFFAKKTILAVDRGRSVDRSVGRIVRNVEYGIRKGPLPLGVKRRRRAHPEAKRVRAAVRRRRRRWYPFSFRSFRSFRSFVRRMDGCDDDDDDDDGWEGGRACEPARSRRRGWGLVRRIVIRRRGAAVGRVGLGWLLCRTDGRCEWVG